MVSKETRNKISGKRTSRLQQDIIYDVKKGRVDRNYSKGEYITAVTLNDNGIEEGVISGNDPEILTEDGCLKKGTIYKFYIEGKIIKSISYIDHDASEDADASEEIVIGCLYDSEPATKEREKKGNMRDARSIDGAISRVLKAAPNVDAALLEQNLRAAFKAAEAGIALPTDSVGLSEIESLRAKSEVEEGASGQTDANESSSEKDSLHELFRLIRDEDFPKVWDAFTAAYIARGYSAADFSAVVAHPNNATAHLRLRSVAESMLAAQQALSQKTGFKQAKIEVELTSPPKRFDHTLPLGLTDNQIASLWTREKWRARKDKSEKFPDFLKRVYGDLLGHGLIPSDFRRKDPTTGKPYEQPLYQARLDWLKHSPMPVDIDLPDQDEVTDRLAYAIATNPSSVPLKTQGRVKLAVASRDVRKLAIS